MGIFGRGNVTGIDEALDSPGCLAFVQGECISSSGSGRRIMRFAGDLKP